ncbi:DUF3500 domain-containing protein [Aureliella helgolandensis]|uniref:DUF3500 domain-containing protein n=1 Tax=Aureliella helgolandensis TaxID=2527968 RepID=A0A518G963_9BACT|nr:DUF3500 domain-containing protein [Aureliella helgolandensis]QDV25112.1 hypothetical protein Q31a_34350 [Aureliella helgolandensis]
MSLILPRDRRSFLKQSAAVVAASSCLPIGIGSAAAEKTSSSESLVKVLYDSLKEEQRSKMCYDWNHIDPQRGLLRSRVSANWMINEQEVNSDFYTADQKDLIRKVFEGILDPQWISKFDQQLDDDCGGFGEEQSIAIFGKPGDDKFELVLTGRHMTLRCDGDSAEHVAFGGPIFYGHAPTGGDEEADHAGNVFWNQALAANNVYQMLDGKQRKAAQVAKTTGEQKVGFQGNDGRFTGIPVTELSADQKAEMQVMLKKLVEPFRQSDQQEALACLKSQGGLDACHLSFFTDNDLGKDEVWDNWRLEGPSFVWHYRGAPHVHVWVNVADSPTVSLNV